jgi:hypothetical protein
MSETNVLAIVAIVMSAVSLAWQATSWLLSGAVIRAWVKTDGDRVTVTAYNSGRAAATITSVSASMDMPASFMQVDRARLPESDPIPYRIVEGGHAAWHFKIVDLSFLYLEHDPMRSGKGTAREDRSTIRLDGRLVIGNRKVIHAEPTTWWAPHR